MSKPKELTELEAADRAVNVWNEFGKPLGLKVYGWTYFNTASFVTQNKRIVSGSLGGGDNIEALKEIREAVTGEKFTFPKAYYIKD